MYTKHMTQDRNQITITEEESKCCMICGRIFQSARNRMWHVRKEHSLNFEEYILQTYYNGIRPICLKTGIPLTFKEHKLGPWFSNYSKNNFPRKEHSDETREKIKLGCEKTSMEKFGVKNVFSTDWCKDKIQTTMLRKYGVENPMFVDEFKLKMVDTFLKTLKNKPAKPTTIQRSSNPNRQSTLELDFSLKLKLASIEFMSPFVYDGRKFDFYIPEINMVIEIDGEVYHADKLMFLSLITINGSCNDYRKNKLMKDSKYEFCRIRYDVNDFNFQNISELASSLNKNTYVPDYSMDNSQVLLETKYLKRYIRIRGKEKLKEYTSYILKFIRTFVVSCPILDANICKRWDNDNILKDIISDVIGCGKYNESNDLTINNIVEELIKKYE